MESASEVAKAKRDASQWPGKIREQPFKPEEMLGKESWKLRSLVREKTR